MYRLFSILFSIIFSNFSTAQSTQPTILHATQATFNQSDSTKRWIVKLRPAHQNQFKKLKSANLHEQFLGDIKKISRGSGHRLKENIAVHHSFKTTFNGFSITATTAAKSALEKLPYVERVIEDKKLKLLDNESNAIINAPSVWQNYGATGRNISIGIIDTGIDYNHPELGGGFGNGFKVKGGYDFADMDPDPMDVYGHGTHVAGIIAANGPTLRGVAPDATLYAYRIYSNEGNGYDSWMMAAIERCLDPDQNPNTDDKVDVINISFGRPVDPYEPLSEVIENAIAKGITFVLAAGNAGTYESIYTPGVTANAITVGASNQDFGTVWFSSKGPLTDFALKPDVLAPGFNIYSAWVNNGYTWQSGTSMSSPSVAGAAALIKELHPAWTPLQIKAALMNTATPYPGEDLLTGGAGQIDILKAVEADVIISPGSLSLGLLNKNLTSQSFQKTLTIRNDSDISTTVTLAVSGEKVDESIFVSFMPAVINIGANSEYQIDVSFTIDVSSLPFKNFPELYSGFITATMPDGDIKIPYGFFHSNGTTLDMSGGIPENIWIIGTHTNPNFRIVYPKNENENIVVAAGNYDIIAHYNDFCIVVKEDISLPIENVSISKSEAKNTIRFSAVNEHGKALKFDQKNNFITLSGINKNYYGTYTNTNVLKISDLSTYQLNYRAYSQIERRNIIYDISLHTPVPLLTNSTYQNDPNKFSRVKITSGSPYHSAKARAAYTLTSSWAKVTSDSFKLRMPLLIMSNPRSSEALSPSPGYAHVWDRSPAWQTGAFEPYNDMTMRFFDATNRPLATLPYTDFNYCLGQSLPALVSYTNNLDDRIRILDLNAFGYFKYSLGEYPRELVSYRIVRNEDELKSGVFFNRFITDELAVNSTFPEYKIIPGVHAVELSMPHSFEHTRGLVKSILKFDTQLPDKNPPIIIELSLLLNNRPIDVFLEGQSAAIKLVMADNCIYTPICDSDEEVSIQVFAQSYKQQDWIELVIPGDYQSDHLIPIPPDIGTGVFNLKIIATDLSGNQLTHVVQPAFRIKGNHMSHPPVLALVSPTNNSLTNVAPKFSWSDAVSSREFEIEVSADSLFSGTTIKATSIEAEVVLPKDLKFDQKYFWRVRAIEADNSASEWSSVGYFKTITDVFKLELIRPENNTSFTQSNFHFDWMTINTPYYRFQTSELEDFSSVVLDTLVFENTITVDDLSDGRYYWRVGFDLVGLTRWSDAFAFTKERVAIPEAKSDAFIRLAYNKPNPFSNKTNIVYQLQHPEPAQLIIFNSLGQIVHQQTINEERKVTEQTIEWPINESKANLPAGLYFAKIKSHGSEKGFAMIVIK